MNISWSGAAAGTNNSITGYTLKYSISSNNSSWGDWNQLDNISSASTSGSTTFSGATITRGNYIKFRIRGLGAASSDYIESELVQRDDNTGMRFALNNKYTKMYLYVGKNGNWVEHDVAAGVNGN